MRVWKFVVVLSVVAVAAVVAGCGGSGGDKTAKGQVELTVWSWGGAASDRVSWFPYLPNLDKAFEKKYPNIKINHVMYPFTGYDARVSAALAARRGPDVIAQFDDRNWRAERPIDDLLTAQQKNDLTLIPTSQTIAKDGKTHLLPIGTYAGVFAYNKALFRKAGLNPDAPPSTLPQFLDMCDKLWAAHITPIVWGFKDAYQGARMVAPLASQTFAEADAKAWSQQKIPYTDPRYAKALAAFVQTVQHHCYGDRPETKMSTTADPAFRGGKSALLYNQQTIDTTAFEKTIGKGNLGVMENPAIPGGRPDIDASLAGGWAMVKWISKPKQDAAWKYLSFIASPEGELIGWNDDKQLPNNKTAMKQVHANHPVFTTLLHWLATQPLRVGAWPVGPKEETTYDQNIVELLAGRMSQSQFLDEMQKVRSAAVSSGGQ
jgi:ABC-type glycerol-3-phosphate transport system substrate-binding protein